MTSELLRNLLIVNLALGAAILVAIGLRDLIRRRFGARMAYGLWLAVPLAMLAVFVPRPDWVAGVLPAAAPLPLVTADAAAVAVSAVAAPMPAAVSLPDLVLLLWLAGVAISGVLTLLAHRRGMASFGRLSASKERGTLRAAKTGLGPAMVGIWRPRLVLPADFETRFNAREQALILAHETHHRQSGDTRVNGVVAVLTCLNWFNPLVHLAAFLLRVDQELACDAAVVGRFPGERRTYAEALLKTQLAPSSLPLGCTWPSGSKTLLQERLTMLAFTPPGRRRLMAGGALIGALCLGTAVAAWAATAAPVRPVVKTPAAPVAATPTLSLAPPRAAATVTPSVRPAPEAEEPAPAQNGYVCLSNSCATQAQAAAAAAPAAALALQGEGPAATREQRLERLTVGLMGKLTPEQLATGNLVLVDKSSGDEVDLQVNFVGADGQVHASSRTQLRATSADDATRYTYSAPRPTSANGGAQ